MDIFKTTFPFDIKQLPIDVLTFTDEKFYGFVKEMLGQTAVDLLQIQAINNVPSFLLSHDVCAVIELDIDSQELDDLRRKICFRCRDGSYHVKIGIKNDFKYLKELLLSKLKENKKTKPKPRQVTTKIYSTSSILTNHTEFAYNLINKWVEDNKENFNCDELELTPDVDYTLTISDNDDDIQGVIKCKCGVKIKLRKIDNRFQMTNFYKHLRSLTCSMIREKKKKNSQKKQLSNNRISNSNSHIVTDNSTQTTASPPETPEQSLLQTSATVPTSLYSANESSPTTAKGIKRASSGLIPTHSQQSSSPAKRYKK